MNWLMVRRCSDNWKVYRGGWFLSPEQIKLAETIAPRTELFTACIARKVGEEKKKLFFSVNVSVDPFTVLLTIQTRSSGTSGQASLFGNR